MISWNQILTSVLQHSWDVHSRSLAPQPLDWHERFSHRPSRWCWTHDCWRAFLVRTPGGGDRQSRDSVEAYLQVLFMHLTGSTFLPMTNGYTSECETSSWLLFEKWHKHPNTSAMTAEGWRRTVAGVYCVTRPSRLECRRTECDSCHLEPARSERVTVRPLPWLSDYLHDIQYVVIDTKWTIWSASHSEWEQWGLPVSGYSTFPLSPETCLLLVWLHLLLPGTFQQTKSDA